MRVPCALFVLLAVVGVGHARADAIGGEISPECPAGGRVRRLHGNLYCVIDPCSTDADCRGGRCTTLRACTETWDVVVFWSADGVSEERENLDVIVSSCPAGGACAHREPIGDVPGEPVAGTRVCTDRPVCVSGATAGATAEPSAPASDPPATPPSSSPPATPGSTAEPAAWGCRAAPPGGGGTVALAVLAVLAPLAPIRRCRRRAARKPWPAGSC